MITLDDLLIYGDWLEDNSIKNYLYKQFLNLLRIKLRINNDWGYHWVEYINSDVNNGGRISYGRYIYGYFDGNGLGNTVFADHFIICSKGDGNGDGGRCFGWLNGNGKSI